MTPASSAHAHRSLVSLASVFFLVAPAISAAQVTTPDGRALPQSAQQAPPFQQIGSGDGGAGGDISVDCDGGETIAGALAKARPGSIIQVTGVCRENVVVREELHRITLQSHSAAIIGQLQDLPTVLIHGKSVLIKGFAITGPCSGIEVMNGGIARIEDNTIEAGCVGIGVRRNSHALITGNTVRDTEETAITVEINSSADIGWLTDLETPGSPNIVRNSGGGIRVTRSSVATVVGNHIANNTKNNSGRDGVSVLQSSQAYVCGNTIEANAGSGIGVHDNSSVSTGRGTGGPEICDDSSLSGNTAVTPNARYGIACGGFSLIHGVIGTLNGTLGQTDFTSTCFNDAIP